MININILIYQDSQVPVHCTAVLRSFIDLHFFMILKLDVSPRIKVFAGIQVLRPRSSLNLIKSSQPILTSVRGHEICSVHHPGRCGDHGHQDRHHDQHRTLSDRAPGLGHGRVTDEYVSLDR